MARINVDDEIGSDPRFIKLLGLLQGDYWRALGLCVGAWRMGQKFFKDVDAKGIIPLNEWAQTDFAPILECGLAIEKDGGIYIKGSKDKFAWLDKKVEAGKIGGKKSADSRKRKKKQNEANASSASSKTEHSSSKTKQVESKPNQEASETNPLPLPLPPTLPLPRVLTNTNPPNPQGEMRVGVSALEKSAAEIKAELELLGVTINPDQVIDLFNTKLAPIGKLLRCRGLGAPSQKQLLNTCTKLQTLDAWEELFLKVKSLDKLTGIKPGVFLATLDWLSVEENALKVLNGKYDNELDSFAAGSSKGPPTKLDQSEVDHLLMAGEL